MNKKDDKVIFRIDENGRVAFQELRDKYCINISAFLRKCLIAKHRTLQEQEKK